MAKVVADLLCALISGIKLLTILASFGLCAWISRGIVGWPDSISFEHAVDKWHIDMWLGLALFLGLFVYEPTKIVFEDVLAMLTAWQDRLKFWAKLQKGRLGRR